MFTAGEVRNLPAEDSLMMTIEDNHDLPGSESKEVARVLEKIFTERCGLTVEVQFEFTEPTRKEEEPAERSLRAVCGKETKPAEDYLSGADGRPIFRTRRTARCRWESGRTAAAREKSGNAAAMSADKAEKAPGQKAALPEHQRGRAQNKKKEFGKKTFGEFKKGDGGSGFKRGEGGTSAVPEIGKSRRAVMEGILTASPWRSVKSSAKSAR